MASRMEFVSFSDIAVKSSIQQTPPSAKTKAPASNCHCPDSCSHRSFEKEIPRIMSEFCICSNAPLI
jgi:hypothetical protein